MLIVGTTIVVLVALLAVFSTFRLGLSRVRASVTVIAFGLAIPAFILAAAPADAAAVPTVPLATASEYSVLAGSTVTNTGPSVLAGSVGLSPGTSVTGFPPGIVTPPATTKIGDSALQAKTDLTTAYDNAAGRSVTATTSADLVGLNLTAGVYSGPDKSALALGGTLTLNGEGNADAVFIFQTDSTLITASSSTIELINGAQACNVFWQVGSSATLGTNSTFVGTVLAHTSVTVNNGVTVHGRALASTGAVTLDDDTFTDASCESPATTTTSGSGSSTTLQGGSTTSVGSGSSTTLQGGSTTSMGSGSSTTAEGGSTTTTVPGGPTTSVGVTTSSPSSGPSTTVATSLSTQTQRSGPSSSTGSGMTGETPGTGGSGSTTSTDQLPMTGWPTAPLLIIAGLLVTGGLVSLLAGRGQHSRSLLGSESGAAPESRPEPGTT